MSGLDALQKVLICMILLTAFSVSYSGEFIYVAIDGNDNDQGTQNRPFATIQRAKRQVRGIIAAGMTSDITVVIREGTYYLPDGLHFSPADGGTEKYAVTYRADHDHEALLVGGVVVQDWKHYHGSIWQSSVDFPVRAKQIFEDNNRMQLARLPEDGFFTIEDGVADKPNEAFIYRSEDIDPDRFDLSDARVLIFQGEWWSSRWFSQDKAIVRVDRSSREILMDSKSGYDMHTGNEYFIYNIPQALNKPGQAFIDYSNNRVRVWPSRRPVWDTQIILPTAEHVLRLSGTRDNPVNNLHFERLHISICNEHTVLFENATHCSIRFSRIENAALSGVMISSGSQHITVYGNQIREHGYCGIKLDGRGRHGIGEELSGPDITAQYINKHHRIENNHIHHCGRRVKHGTGVMINQSGDNKILHNRIHHMPRYGTSMKGLRFQILRQQVDGVTWENRHDFLHSRNNLFAFNHIHHVNLETMDTGAMESWGSGRDNVYKNNLIHDTGNVAFPLQSGIYIDDACDYYTVTKNIIYNVQGESGTQPILAKGIGHKIHNNILVVATDNCSAIRSLEMGQEPTYNHQYYNNIIYYDRTEPALLDYGHSRQWSVDIPEEDDYVVWVEYSQGNYMTGRSDDILNGISYLIFNEDTKLTVPVLPSTREWDNYTWKAVAEVSLSAGKQIIRWHNKRGRGYNIKTIKLVDRNSRWEPGGLASAKVTAVIKADVKLGSWRSLYEFNNYCEDRLSVCDSNIYWKYGDKLFVQGSPACGSYTDWLLLHERRYDQNSVIKDPLFFNVEGRDFRLRPESPAWALGFEPIDIQNIGLKEDFPFSVEVE